MTQSVLDGPKRLRSLTDVARLKELIDEEPHQIKRACSLLMKKTNKTFHLSTLKRTLKQVFGYSYKRARHSLKGKRDERKFRSFQKIALNLINLEERGELDLFYFDESGFSQKSNIPYAWSPVGEPLELDARSRSERLNVLGFLSRAGQLHTHITQERVTSETVIEAFEMLLKSKPQDRVTAVILDNASIHRSKIFKSKCQEWMDSNLFVHFLPTYSPELNFIEILWRKIKYEWLPISAYESFEDLEKSLKSILANYPSKFRISFA